MKYRRVACGLAAVTVPTLLLLSLLNAPVLAQRAPEDITGYEPTTYYYGWQGMKMPLFLSGQQIGIAFEQYTSPRTLDTFARAHPDIPLSVDVSRLEEGLEFTAAVVNLRDDVRAEGVREVAERVQQQVGVRATLPVYRHPSGRRSLLTDMLSVILPTSIAHEQAEDLFAQEGLEVLDVNDYDVIGKSSYRLRMTDAARQLVGRNTLTAIEMANRVYQYPWVIDAAPMFAPLYSTQDDYDVTPPNDGDYPGDDGQWHLRRMGAEAAWDKVYQVDDPSTTGVDESGLYPWPDNQDELPSGMPEIVVACMDNGVWMNYKAGSREAPNGQTYTFPDPAGLYITTSEDDVYNADPLAGHDDLNPNQWLNYAELSAGAANGIDDDGNGYVDDCYGWDFVGTNPFTSTPSSGDKVPFPDPSYLNEGWVQRHGTAAAGKIGARGNNTTAVAGIVWGAKLMPVRYHINAYHNGDDVLETKPADVYTMWRAELAIRYAVDNGAQVIAPAMGFQTYDPGFHAAIQYARAKGCFLCSSAGNREQSLDSDPFFPQIFPETLTVGASISAKEASWGGASNWECRVNFSHYGWAVDLMAPVHMSLTAGESARNDIANTAEHLSTGIEGPTAVVHGSGTSSSFPQVAGLAALLLTVNPKLSPQELGDIMKSTAVDLQYEIDTDRGVEQAGVGRDYYTGYGRIDAEAAVIEAMRPRFSVTRRVTTYKGTRDVGALAITADGDVVIDGELKSETQSVLNAWTSAGEFIIQTSGGATVARLEPTTGMPILYLLGTEEQGSSFNGILTDNSRQFLVTNGSGTVKAYIDTSGNLRYTGTLSYLGQDDPVIKRIPDDYDTPQDFIDDNLTNRGAIGVVEPGTYGPIDFSGADVVLMSEEFWDKTCVQSTVIDANGSGSAVVFDGDEGEDAALIGFTITGGAGVAQGGGINGNGCMARILYNIIKDNSAGDGGGIAGCDGLIENNIIGDAQVPNSATGGGGTGEGGGLYDCQGVIRNNRIVYNTADNGGGLAFCDATILGNYIAENDADDGGGLYACDGRIESNIVYHNAADVGGGLHACNGSAIEQNTVYGNSVTANQGGGMDTCSATQVRNNIVWGNSPSSNQLVPGTTPNYSCIQNWGGGGTNNITSDPLFVSTTSTASWHQFLHIQSTSPCIDKGETASPPVLFHDFDYQIGPVEGSDPDNPPVISSDMGADEWPTPAPGTLHDYWWERFQ